VHRRGYSIAVPDGDKEIGSGSRRLEEHWHQ
jgi:hypothetical protein